ncbi:molybdopterin synthase catalytic subunit [Desulfatibacillum alkenivorans DSM 16219]|jgi:molybdopterin synthase catalytic subunit|uniref:Molybdopterin synthase catalytic subunit n=1 Tax=Desulfatibacillum alkenivorans DSM 16219 TaxID=1121393 RepID=A0A1M6CNR7_9BACT|nr:molybdenum cofactor biosynthesis protein MoaE [Desulfatibacillum alkenivorans]SHI62620.1 molybdopterin synthase catalytic subunit [Desulfatibacillum alkenivorans DSM 16219]
MGVTAFTTKEPFDLQGFMDRFREAEDDSTGTIVMHHGKVKRPGKVVRDFSRVLLEPVLPSPEKGMQQIGQNILKKYGLNQVFIVHRTGEIHARDDVLFVAVSAVTRDIAFSGCADIVDAIKEEKILRLVEVP